MLKRQRMAIAWPLFSLLILGTDLLYAAPPSDQTSFRETFERKLQSAEQGQRSVIEGLPGSALDPGWLFFTPELRAVLSPQFWGESATAVSRSSNPKFADPLTPIVDFHSQLKAAGIELWLVPVPAKVVVYPHHCVSDETPGSAIGRLDMSHVEFYKVLKSKGVHVIDLTAEFREAALKTNATAKRPLYCATDTHWSGSGIELTARALSEQIQKREWYSPLSKSRYQTEPQSVEITGDLALFLNEKKPARETLNLTRVIATRDTQPQNVADDPLGPILLLGDSHTLIFHDPALYAQGCGLADHLALQVGFPMDVIGVRGSGANAARLNWRRRADPLKHKKLVIWCFSMREFTENTDGWRVIPIAKR